MKKKQIMCFMKMVLHNYQLFVGKHLFVEFFSSSLSG